MGGRSPPKSFQPSQRQTPAETPAKGICAQVIAAHAKAPAIHSTGDTCANPAMRGQ